MPRPIIPPHGGYKALITYRKSDHIFRGTAIFVRRFLKPGDRTIGQMEQAARSGKQNIIEGSEASATSKATELTLTNVAKASLEELLEDYLDYLKLHDLHEWPKDSPKGLAARTAARAATWETAAHSRLSTARTPAELDALLSSMTSTLRRLASTLRRQHACPP